jgi:tRNA pseudouridine32 synthase/23S rRNA pseudouridine746 synthase
MSSIPILYEDGEALVIDKPAGLPIERPRAGGRSLEDHWDELKLGFQRRPTPVHRLDTDTSGCLLLARNPKALKRFNAAFEARMVTKWYLGIVAGTLPTKEGTIDLALSKVSSAAGGWHMIVAKKGKPATTHWREVEQVGGLTLVQFQLVTGRTHQIRIHAAEGLGLPLLGDRIYGSRDGAARTMLHAGTLQVPREGKTDVIGMAPMPADFLTLGFADTAQGFTGNGPRIP